jgi:hypothetical protein
MRLPTGGYRKQAKITVAAQAPIMQDEGPHKWATGISTNRNTKGTMDRTGSLCNKRASSPASAAHNPTPIREFCGEHMRRDSSMQSAKGGLGSNATLARLEKQLFALRQGITFIFPTCCQYLVAIIRVIT